MKDLYKEKISIKCADGFVDYVDNLSVYHEAGFDAFVTGCAFIYMKEVFGEQYKQYHNKLYLMRSIYSCFYLDGEEPYLYPNVYYLYNI